MYARMKTGKLTRRQILALLRKHQDVLVRYGVKRIGLFGSYAKGMQRQRSDVDFIVEFQEPTFENFIGLVEYLEKTFGKKVDILTPEGIGGIRVKEVAESIKKSVVYA